MRLSVPDIVNYSVRISIICLGLYFLSGKAIMVPGDPSFTTWIGVAFIVFGTYRAVLYYIRTRQSQREQEDDEAENMADEKRGA